MISVIQRVSQARVVVGGEVAGQISAGLLVLLCAERGDARLAHPQVETGQFAADMQVRLVNDGPVTIPLRIPPDA